MVLRLPVRGGGLVDPGVKQLVSVIKFWPWKTLHKMTTVPGLNVDKLWVTVLTKNGEG